MKRFVKVVSDVSCYELYEHNGIKWIFIAAEDDVDTWLKFACVEKLWFEYCTGEYGDIITTYYRVLG